jgi:hypothetical protein
MRSYKISQMYRTKSVVSYKVVPCAHKTTFEFPLISKLEAFQNIILYKENKELF